MNPADQSPGRPPIFVPFRAQTLASCHRDHNSPFPLGRVDVRTDRVAGDRAALSRREGSPLSTLLLTARPTLPLEEDWRSLPANGRLSPRTLESGRWSGWASPPLRACSSIVPYQGTGRSGSFGIGHKISSQHSGRTAGSVGATRAGVLLPLVRDSEILGDGGGGGEFLILSP